MNFIYKKKPKTLDLIRSFRYKNLDLFFFKRNYTYIHYIIYIYTAYLNSNRITNSFIHCDGHQTTFFLNSLIIISFDISTKVYYRVSYTPDINYAILLQHESNRSSTTGVVNHLINNCH